MKLKATFCWMGLLLIFAGKIYALECGPLDPREHVTKETENEIRGKAETLFKVGRVEGDFKRRTKETATTLYKNHPNYDKTLLKSKLIYFYCTILDESNLPFDEQMEMLQHLTEALELPTSDSTGLSEGEVKSFAEQWVETVKSRSADKLLSLSDLPFYFDEYFIFTRGELRKQYLDFLGIQYIPGDKRNIGMWRNFGNPNLTPRTEVRGISAGKLKQFPKFYNKKKQIIDTLNLNYESPIAIVNLGGEGINEFKFALFVHKNNHMYKAIGACNLIPPY